MMSLLRKFALGMLPALVLGTIAFAPMAAQAAPQYTWTDISSQLSERQNRPVWAIAYAAPYWYATDGQELWSGGHVWRTDGTYVVDITTEVRNAGLSRVDDIVTDGKTVVYLKNITRRDRNFEMLSYSNGSYAYPSYSIFQKLDSDEGIVSLNGKDGVWSFVTTKSRVFLWNMVNNTEYTRVNLPTNYSNQLAYSVKHVSPASSYFLPIISLPTSNGWLLGNRESNGVMRFWRMSTDGTRTDITSQLPSMTVVHFAASNGSTAILASATSDQLTTTSLVSFDGSNYQYINEENNNFGAIWYGMSAAYTNNHWIAVTNKIVYDIDLSTRIASRLPETKDLFVTVAANESGTTLFGGAESVMGSQQPSSPLMAKLVKAQYGYYSNNNTGSTGYFGGNRTYTSSNGPTITTSGNPSNFIVGNGKNFIYRVTATDPQGIDRIDLYVNGARIKTCNSETCDFDNTYYTNGASSRMVTFMARVTDRSGWSTETSNEYLTVDQSSNTAGSGSTGSGSTTNGSTTIWDWLTPSVNSIKRSETITYGAGAWNSNGLNRVELWVNGSIRRTCTSSSDMNNCTTVLYGSDYSVGSNVAMNARAVTSNGQETWTTLRNLSIVSDSNSNNNGNYNSNGSIWINSNPDVTTLNNGATALFSANASDSDGVNRIEILKDGTVVKTCYTTYCDYTVGSSSNGSATFSARMFDVYGNQVTSNSRTYSFTNSNGSNNGNTTNGATNIWDWIDPNVTSMNRNSQLTYHVGAWNSNGLNRVELWVNGTIRKTCYGTTQDCAFTLVGTEYSANANIAFNARAIDNKGTETWTTLRNLYVSDTTTGGNSSVDDNTNAHIYGWSSPDVPNIHIGSSVLYRVLAVDTDGVNRVEILKNGNVVKTCNTINKGYAPCEYVVNADSNGSAIITGRMYDVLGKRITTEARTYLFSNTDISYTNTGTSNVWDWTTSNITEIHWSETVQYHAGAWNEKNINRVELLVNGTVRKVCYGNTQDCVLEIHGLDYTPGNTVLRARATDTNGNVNWTAERILNIRGGSMGGSGDHLFYFPGFYTNTESPTGSTNTNGTITVSSDRDAGYTNTSYITITAKGSDADGVAKIEILVNGSLQKTCNNLSTCSTTVGPFGTLKSVSYMARLTDKKGNVVKTAYTIISHK